MKETVSNVSDFFFRHEAIIIILSFFITVLYFTFVLGSGMPIVSFIVYYILAFVILGVATAIVKIHGDIEYSKKSTEKLTSFLITSSTLPFFNVIIALYVIIIATSKLLMLPFKYYFRILAVYDDFLDRIANKRRT